MGPVDQASAAPQDAPAAGEPCLTCHEEVAQSFSGTVHGRAEMPDWGDGQGCAGCHGAAIEHSDSGETTDLRVFPAMSPEDANSVCLTCHTGHAAYWRGSTHDIQEVRCTDCHQAHAEWSDNHVRDNRQVTDTCLSCHAQHKKNLFQRSSHPLRDGQMSCVSCHDPHGSPVEAAVASITVNEKCYECHAEMRGPFLWNHVPVNENCMNCHNPHGSNQRNLLVQSAPRLCQSCHLFGHHQTVPGRPTQVWNVNNSCTNCHARVHGSNHPSGVVFLR
jgi:DmsE family decaheme c-type cytochrome